MLGAGAGEAKKLRWFRYGDETLSVSRRSGALTDEVMFHQSRMNNGWRTTTTTVVQYARIE